MMYIKSFSNTRVVISDGNNDYVLETTNDMQSFDRDIIEDILDFVERETNIV